MKHWGILLRIAAFHAASFSPEAKSQQAVKMVLMQAELLCADWVSE